MNRLAALALVLCPVMGLGPAPKGWQAPASAKIGAAMVCKTPAPSTAAGYKGAIDGLDDASWGGADQSTSVMLADGRIVWIYADTVRTGSFRHNSFIIQTRGCFTPIGGSGAESREVIPNLAASGTAPLRFFWPQAGYAYGNKMYVFSMRVEAVGGQTVTTMSADAALASIAKTLNAAIAGQTFLRPINRADFAELAREYLSTDLDEPIIDTARTVVGFDDPAYVAGVLAGTVQP